METNKTDKIFKDAFKNRTLEPSNSSWDRLSQKLDVEEKKNKKKGFIYLGYAASILAIVAFSYTFLIESSSTSEEITKEIVDTDKTEKIVPLEYLPNKKELKSEPKIANEQKIKKRNFSKNLKQHSKNNSKQFRNIEEIIDTRITENSTIEIDTSDIYMASSETMIIKEKSTKIKINPLDLLNSIENENAIAINSSEILSKSEKLKIIEQELTNKNISISPEKLLAEVEADTEEKSFREKFLKSIKNNITTLANAINERNK
jgi:hypothetical protein